MFMTYKFLVAITNIIQCITQYVKAYYLMYFGIKKNYSLLQLRMEQDVINRQDAHESCKYIN